MKHLKESIFNNKDEFINHIKNLKSDPDYKEKWLKEKEEKVKEYWKTLKPFEKSTDVPHLPIPLDEFYTNKLIELGAIKKSDLKDGVWYYGNYRNSRFGKWNSNENVFDHIRYSFGFYWDKCNHFEDDDGFAIFVPLREATPEEIKKELDNVKTSK